MAQLSVAKRSLRNSVPYLILAAPAVGSGATVWASSPPSKVQVGPEGIVLDNVANVAPASSTVTGAKVDGMRELPNADHLPQRPVATRVHPTGMSQTSRAVMIAVRHRSVIE